MRAKITNWLTETYYNIDMEYYIEEYSVDGDGAIAITQIIKKLNNACKNRTTFSIMTEPRVLVCFSNKVAQNLILEFYNQ